MYFTRKIGIDKYGQRTPKGKPQVAPQVDNTPKRYRIVGHENVSRIPGRVELKHIRRNAKGMSNLTKNEAETVLLFITKRGGEARMVEM